MVGGIHRQGLRYAAGGRADTPLTRVSVQSRRVFRCCSGLPRDRRGDNGLVVSLELALALQDAGLIWHPVSGDTFAINREGFEGEIFVVSDMTIESNEFDTGTILGFNGTTEWALDSIALENAIWLPHEHQLRELLGGTFRTLTRLDAGYRVDVVVNGEPGSEEATDAADAYAAALLGLVRAAL